MGLDATFMHIFATQVQRDQPCVPHVKCNMADRHHQLVEDPSLRTRLFELALCARRTRLKQRLYESNTADTPGYSELSAFTRAFKRQHGVSPRQTR